MKTFVFLFLLFPVMAYTDTITVKQDGTGNYTTINQAIMYAANGDTILVYPGVYYEHVYFWDKEVTLASLYLTTQQTSYISQTIIDGSNTESCVTMLNTTHPLTITGFTIQNGYAFETIPDYLSGGGLSIFNCSQVAVNHCIIQNNTGYNGGGIFSYNTNLSLAGNIIRYNHSTWIGGGINAGPYSLFFDTIDLNSIYMNYAYIGLDVARSYETVVNNIKLDTATISNPDYYFISSLDWRMFYLDDITMEANYGIMEQVDSDLYVSPAGSNDNNGLSPDSSLKTIAYALQKIKKNSNRINTIHLANGIYSASATGEKLPLCFKDSIAITGQSRKGTIIDSELTSSLGTLPPGEDLLILKKFTHIRGNGYTNPFLFGSVWSDYNKKTLLDSIVFDSCRSSFHATIEAGTNDSTIVSNCVFSHNRGANIAITGNSYDINTSNINIISTRFIANYSDTLVKVMVPLQIHGLEVLVNGNGYVKTNVINCEFSDNVSSDDNYLSPALFGMSIRMHSFGNLINTTFCNNTGSINNDGIAFGVEFSSTVNTYNCIFYDNFPHQILVGNLKPENTDSLYIYNSCVEGGAEDIIHPGPYYYLYYDTSNIEKDPLFYGGEEFPYNLSDKSPCIDAGTLELPEGVTLPEYDLAGNPRIFNGKIDMGAYEWNPTVGTEEHPTPNTQRQTPNLQVYPNPFNTTTTIAARWETAANNNIEIYNNAGLLVKTLQQGKQLPGSCKIPWNGTDNSGNILPAGIYYVVLRVNAKETKSIKIIKL